MKHNIFILILLIFLLCIAPLCGCGAAKNEDRVIQGTNKTEFDPTLAKLCKTITDKGYLSGIAFIGYIGSETGEDGIRDYIKSSQYAEQYPFLSDAPFVDAGGTEVYAVVSAKSSCNTYAYSANIDDRGNVNTIGGTPLYNCKGLNCFLLRCNASEVSPNVLLTFKTNEDELALSPVLSGADGRLAAADCYDFSFYADDSGLTDKNIKIAYEILLEADEIRDRCEQGMTLLYTDKQEVIDGRECYIFALGTNSNQQFVSEYLYGVCDNLIYSYDAVNDAWCVLGAG